MKLPTMLKISELDPLKDLTPALSKRERTRQKRNPKVLYPHPTLQWGRKNLQKHQKRFHNINFQRGPDPTQVSNLQ